MGRLAVLIMLASVTLPAWGSRRVSVAQLEQMVAAAQGKPDAEAAQQLYDLELTERLSADRLSQLETALPGKVALQSLQIIADRSAFLALPASDIPATPAPTLAEQRRIMGLAIGYVTRTIPQLPNFFATRTTNYFEDTPLVQRSFGSTAYQPLHFVRASSATVLYRKGREEVDAGPEKKAGKKTVALEPGLTSWGVFGPILGTVFEDAARSTLTWSHWEKGRHGAVAVFSYAVPREKSHYEVNYCCTPQSSNDGNPARFRRLSSYHGEIAINPQDGTILRLVVDANLTAADPITRAALLVEYGSVEIGGKSYFCPVKSLSMSVAQELQLSNELGQPVAEYAVRPLKTLLNDVAFEQYHMFRADVRVVPESEAEKQASPDKNESAQAAIPAAEPERVQDATAENKSAAGVASPPPISAKPDVTAPVASGPPEVPLTAKPEVAAMQAPTLRTTSREVVVDVVVTKGNGDPVLGLGKQDFVVTEDGKAQSVDYFEDHSKTAQAASAPTPMPAMPAGSRTNVPPAPEGDSVNVLLLDTLNTEPPDQAYVHREVMDFLTHMQPGTRVAIFMLGSQLRFVQGFTTDTAALVAALNDKRIGMKSEKDLAARSRSDNADDADDVARLKVMRVSPMAIEAILQAQADSRAHDFGARVAMTFEALEYLGHYLSGIPGRKNLIWFSSSFPVVIFPTFEQRETIKQNVAVPGYLDKVRTTADLFTSSRVAVYPIDAEGMQTEQVGEASAATPGAGGMAGHAGSEEEGAMSTYHGSANERGNTVNAMEQLASSTGGKAFYNTNDLNRAMRSAVDDGASYYTIGYSPGEKKLDGRYRQIQVRVDKGKYKLAYRHGYNADDSGASGAGPGVDPVVPLLRFGMPSASGVLYGVKADAATTQPAAGASPAGQNEQLKGPLTRFDVEFVVRVQDLVLQQEAQGGRSGKLLLGVKAYGRDGSALNWAGDQETVEIGPDQYSYAEKTGVVSHLEIDLPSHTGVHLVTAVYDLNSGKAGSLEIEVGQESGERK